jgi:fumarylacetoacetase
MHIDIPADSDFTLANLPFGIFSTPGTAPRAGMAVGNHILDLAALATTSCFDFDTSVLSRPYLNDFIALGKSVTNRARTQVQSWLKNEQSSPVTTAHLAPRTSSTLHLPIQIGDYTDFYSSIEHATNVGKLFRDPENALLPNWRHLPVGYHGRASSIVVSDTDIRRPSGQILPPGSDTPVFGPSERLDFELEMAFVIGKDSVLGQPIPIEEAEDYIFGMLLFNDWSARDIQRWEYVPLGPFLGKSFASSVSPWIVPLAALEPFRTRGPAQRPAPLPYLQREGEYNYDIDLSVTINGKSVCHSNTKNLYWNVLQQLTHHTSNGCNVRVGDVMASGTISGSEPGSYGSLLEITENGAKGDFLKDGDTVTLSAHAGGGDERIGFGEVRGAILASANSPRIATDLGHGFSRSTP